MQSAYSVHTYFQHVGDKQGQVAPEQSFCPGYSYPSGCDSLAWLPSRRERLWTDSQVQLHCPKLCTNSQFLKCEWQNSKAATKVPTKDLKILAKKLIFNQPLGKQEFPEHVRFMWDLFILKFRKQNNFYFFLIQGSVSIPTRCKLSPCSLFHFCGYHKALARSNLSYKGNTRSTVNSWVKKWLRICPALVLFLQS